MSNADIDSNCEIIRELIKKPSLVDEEDRIAMFHAALALLQRYLLDVNRIADAADYLIDLEKADQLRR